MFASKLQLGDEIRIIAPSTSAAIIKDEQLTIATERLHGLGFQVTYGTHIFEHDEFFSSSVDERVEDLHDAFKDPNVKGILTVLGGYNSNQLLNAIDYELIKRNPKVFCGYSDITALSLAIYRKTGLVTYSGPFFSTFGVKYGLDYTMESFLTALTNDAPYEIQPSSHWSDDPWYLDQEKREFIEQDSYLVIHEGEARGRLIGGNLCTMNLLQGTEYMPSLKNAILFIEDDYESHSLVFERDLQSLLQLPDAKDIKAVLIGRFQKDSNVTDEAIKKIIHSKPELQHIPVIANVNFGHVQPLATIPIGSMATVKANGQRTEIVIEQEE
ncbi:S66 family peptidase [Bacillus massilinigeriensis]|uniref:S66 family peptidase n=1 Tax=Bacillus massilionigeriensis TaxID=1805475 RepID=UPI00096B6333|nr:S66 peptidase family protein [Bacillus massilionigeriensis]